MLPTDCWRGDPRGTLFQHSENSRLKEYDTSLSHMRISRFIYAILLTTILVLSRGQGVFAQKTNQVDFFYSPTCPHCARADAFFQELKTENPDLIIRQYQVSDKVELLKTFYKKYSVPEQSWGFVPAIFIDDKYYIGFSDETAQQIETYVTGSSSAKLDSGSKDTTTLRGIQLDRFALPVSAILLGALDGFNICSLGALLIILSLVLMLKSRPKILLFGGGFILTTSVIYGLLILFWYQLFTLLAPYLRQMELIIGLITLAGGIYFLKEFIKFHRQGPICGIGPAQKIEGSFSKQFRSLIQNKARTLTVLFSILLFAIVITVVEFPCSAAVPVAFAGMLTKAQLPGWLYIFYIALYVVFYMLDELLVFFIAFFTMKLWLASPKFVTWITLAESIILFGLGAYYLFGLV